MREKLTQQDIADRVGSSREMVNRVMKELTTGGYVAVRDGHYVILRKLPAAPQLIPSRRLGAGVSRCRQGKPSPELPENRRRPRRTLPRLGVPFAEARSMR